MYTDGSAPEERAWQPEADWRSDERFLYALDLFDHRYMWEAHEAWEALWHFAGDGTAERDLLQSLICCAAASLKHHMQSASAASKLLNRACELMQPWAAQPIIYGVDHARVLADTGRCLQGGGWPKVTLETS